MKNNLILFLTLALTSISCSYEEPITFVRLQEVKVNGVENGDLLLSAKAVFDNPNSVQKKKKKVDIVVLHKGDTLAIVHQTQKLKVPANDQFSVPLSMKIDINKLQKGLLSNLASLISKRAVELEFKGSIKISSWGVSQKVPVDYSEKVKF